MKLIRGGIDIFKAMLSIFTYNEKGSKSLSLSFVQVVCLITTIICIIYAFFAPWLVSLDPNAPADIVLENVKPPFESFHHILGTDAFGRDLLDLFLLGMNKSFLLAIVIVIFQSIVIIPSAIVVGYHVKKHGLWGKFFEPLILFPAVFYYLVFVAIFDHSSLIVYISIILATTIYTFYNHYRDVVQIMSLPMIKTLKMDGAGFKHIVTIVLIPLLIPNTARLLRRVLILVITDLILIATLHISLNPLSPHWGTLVYEAWHYREFSSLSLIVLTVLIVSVLYAVSTTFLIGERYLTLQLKNRAERIRATRAALYAINEESE